MSDGEYYSGLRNGFASGKIKERARIRAKVQAVYDHVGQLGAPGSDPFDFGRITALRQVLDIIDREAPPQ
jgi:hypothetical protein